MYCFVLKEIFGKVVEKEWPLKRLRVLLEKKMPARTKCYQMNEIAKLEVSKVSMTILGKFTNAFLSWEGRSSVCGSFIVYPTVSNEPRGWGDL